MNTIQQDVLNIIKSFPISRNGENYLSLADGRKIFFGLFIRKYGIDGTITKYSHEDIVRRIRLVEFFDSFFKVDFIEGEEIQGNRKKIILESVFHRIVLVETKYRKLELLSFYPFRN